MGRIFFSGFCSQKAHHAVAAKRSPGKLTRQKNERGQPCASVASRSCSHQLKLFFTSDGSAGLHQASDGEVYVISHHSSLCPSASSCSAG